MIILMTSFGFLFAEHEEKLPSKVTARRHVGKEVQRVVQTRKKPLKLKPECNDPP